MIKNEGEVNMKEEIKVAEQETTVRVTFSIKPEILAKLDNLAGELKISRSGCIEDLVRFATAKSVWDIGPYVKLLARGLTQAYKERKEEIECEKAIKNK
jgi:metal-responsive CopG/Arc/MetJ family transcriptional regulator